MTVGRRFAARQSRWIAALVVGAVVALGARPARAFQLEGHEIIEAAAYKRLLAMAAVPGTGVPGVSGRALLASLITSGVLLPPKCFDRANPRGNCDARLRLEMPLGHWPVLGSGAPDLVIDRQLGQRGQCQHFMAETSDGLSPVDPRFGVPEALVTAAYLRCVRLAGAALDGILRDPAGAHWRLVGTYALMHALEDSFSAAHANRDAQLRIVHLLSWTLTDWPRYLWEGHLSFPADTHHAVSDRRDNDYLLEGLRTPDGRACRSFLNPYAVPEVCLTARARAAVDAVVAYLVLIYVLREQARVEGRTASLFSPEGEGERAAWLAFLREHQPSVAAPAELPAGPQSAPPRPDLFLGVQGAASAHTWSVGAWGADLMLVRPVVPFALGLSGGFGFGRSEGAGQIQGDLSLSLLLPLIRRFAIGAAPAGARLVCNGHLGACSLDAVATLGQLLVPLGESMWMGVIGPRWSWSDRALVGTWVAVAVGWSHELELLPTPPGPEAAATWEPPAPEAVHAFRASRWTRAVYLAATAGSQPENTFVGTGLDWRRDRDVWNRRAGLAAGLLAEIDQGTIDGHRRRSMGSAAPTLRAYLVPNRLAVIATPALVRIGAFGGSGFDADVAARASVSLDVGNLELTVDSPPMSYVSPDRWHGLPLTVRLGALLD